MYVKKRMTPNGYMRKVRTEFKKGEAITNILLGSDESSLNDVRNAFMGFLIAAVNYVKLAQVKAKENYMPLQSGLAEKSSYERKELQRYFTVDTDAKRKLFYPEWYDTAFENCMYQLMEAVFDASLILEQSAERRFRELWELYESFKKFVDEENKVNYIVPYGDTILYIEPEKGKIYKANKDVSKRIKKYGIEKFEIYLDKEKRIRNAKILLHNSEYIYLTSDGALSSDVFSCCQTKKDKKKEYIQIVVKEGTHGAPPVQFSAHTILILANYGINTAKFLLSKDSLVTVDHCDMCGNNNIWWNLQLVTRRDNKLRASAKDINLKKAVYGYDLDRFFRHIDSCYNMNKLDIKFKVESLHEYWSEKLKEHSAEELLLGV